MASVLFIYRYTYITHMNAYIKSEKTYTNGMVEKCMTSSYYIGVFLRGAMDLSSYKSLHAECKGSSERYKQYI